MKKLIYVDARAHLQSSTVADEAAALAILAKCGYPDVRTTHSEGEVWFDISPGIPVAVMITFATVAK